jgi:predicted ABC-type ATPase
LGHSGRIGLRGGSTRGQSGLAPKDLAELAKFDANGDLRMPSEVKNYLIDAQFTGKTSKEEPVLTLTGGNSGAGKSTALRNLGIDRTKCVTSDSDYEKFRMGLDSKAPDIHKESSVISEAIIKRAVEEKYTSIYDSRMMKYDRAKNLIEQALSKGYTVNLAFTHVDAETSIVRSALRVMNGESKRVIPEEESIKGHNYALPTFLQLTKEYAGNPKVNYTLVDNNVDGRKAITVVSQRDGKIDIADKDAYNSLAGTKYKEVTEGGVKFYVREEKFTKNDLDRESIEARTRAGYRPRKHKA